VANWLNTEVHVNVGGYYDAWKTGSLPTTAVMTRGQEIAIGIEVLGTLATPVMPGSVLVERYILSRIAAIFPKNPGQLNHIFRNAVGHIPDTPANRRLLSQVASNPANRVGVDQWGNVWYAKIQPDGSQVWVRTTNGVITDGGLNQTARSKVTDIVKR
jgi:hypothetical protein